jgi:VIT1/CCC1 family predicted Fe2+/Mn2+ transporter
VVFTAAAFFLIGWIKGRIVQKPLFRSGMSTLLIGGVAAAVAYAIGYLLNLVV